MAENLLSNMPMLNPAREPWAFRADFSHPGAIERDNDAYS